MEVELIPPKPPVPFVTITLTREEAQQLVTEGYREARMLTDRMFFMIYKRISAVTGLTPEKE